MVDTICERLARLSSSDDIHRTRRLGQTVAVVAARRRSCELRHRRPLLGLASGNSTRDSEPINVPM